MVLPDTHPVVVGMYSDPDEQLYTELEIHAGQLKALTCPKRFIIVSAGTQGGKSWCVAPWLYEEIINCGAGDYLVVGPSFDMVEKNIIFHQDVGILVQWADTELGVNHGATYLASKHKYTIPKYGVQIYFRSADHAESLQGGKYKAAIFDEAGQMADGAAWRAIQQRLGTTRGRALICTTPYGHQWFDDLIERAKSGDPEYGYINWSSIDSPWFSREEYEARRREWPSYLFNMYYNGIYGKPDTLIFTEFSDANITEVSYQPDKPIYVCCDFNGSPLHWVLAQQFGDRLDIFDEIYIPYAAKTQDALDELYNRHCNHTAQFVFFGDASSRSEHTGAATTDYVQIYNDPRFIKLGRHFRWPIGNPNQKPRCDAMSAKIKSAAGDIRLLISPRCKYLIKDIKSMCWIKGTHKIDKPKYDGHGGDALGYCIYQIWPLTVKPVAISSGIYTINTQQKHSMKSRL